MNTKKLSISIGDVVSKESVRSITDSLSKMGGVNKVNVYAVSGLVTLEYDQDSVTLEKIISRINSLGYQIDNINEQSKKNLEFCRTDVRLKKALFLKLITSLFVSVIILYSSYLSVEGVTSFILALFVWFYCGMDFHKEFLKNIPRLDINSLVSISSTAGMILNTSIIFFPSFFMNITPRWQEITLLLSFFNLGRYLESFVVNKSTESFNLMLKMYPKFATVLNNEKQERVEIKDISLNDMLFIKKGEQIPSDCILETDEIYVDESGFTGQNGYVKKKKGDILYATTINVSQDIKAKAIRVWEDTLFMQIAVITKDMYIRKKQITNFIENAIKYLLPLFVILSVLFSILLYYKTGISLSVYSFLYVLMISCPASLGIIFPISILIGFTRASKTGFLFNNPDIIGFIEDVNLLIFDIETVSESGMGNLKDMVKRLRDYQIKPVIASGEDRNRVENIALKLGIKDYYYEVLPQEKHSIVIKYKMLGYNVLMVGDGLNDIAAILNADIGVSVKKGLGITTNAGDLVLMKPDISLIFKAIELSKKINHIIKINFIISIIISFAMIFLFFISLMFNNSPSFLFISGVIFGVFLVMLNSMRLYKINIDYT